MFILDNVIPYIGNEEEKLQSEPKKILGMVEGGKVTFLDLKISAQCNRVPVMDGHTESVSVKLKTNGVTVNQVKEALSGYSNELERLKLPSAPAKLISLHSQPDRPQPRLDRDLHNGYTVSVGRVRECPLFDFKFTVLSHNTGTNSSTSNFQSLRLPHPFP